MIGWFFTLLNWLLLNLMIKVYMGASYKFLHVLVSRGEVPADV